MQGRLRPTVADSRSSHERAEDLVSVSLGAPVHVDIIVPRTAVAGKMRLVTRSEKFEATSETRRALQAGGFPVDVSAITSLGTHDQWQYELGVRILALAVRDPERTERAIASVDEWRECDDDQIEALWLRYQDLEAEIDPLGVGPGLTEEELAAMIAAAKKGDAAVLMSFGSRKLALLASSLAAPSATSPTPPS